MSDFDKRLDQVTNNPQLKAAIVDVVVRDKPLGWSRRSIAPYYKLEYGLQMKSVIDAMMIDKQDVLYSYSEFEEKYGINKDTLYQRINQSIRYLVEQLDDINHIYRSFLETVKIGRERGIGVSIRIVGRDNTDNGFTSPRKIVPVEEVPKWRTQLEEFLNSNEPQLHIPNLALTPEEIAQLQQQLYPLTHIMSVVTAFDIKCIRQHI